MIRPFVSILLGFGLLLVGGGHADGYEGAIDAIFVPASVLEEALESSWDVVHEAPVSASDDPELAGAGVRVSHTRHYTRAQDGAALVCSVEIWAFDRPSQAESIHAQMQPPGWRTARHGNLLVMLRGVTLRGDSGFQKGLLPECRRLAELTEARAAALVD